ncbi:MAG: YdaU family protein [Burkholderiaceae bacterium]
MHYYKRNLGDYAKKAGRLSMLQHGSYTLLIDSCYDREQFPTLEEAIEWTWASTTEEIEAVKFVLSRFFVLENGIYVQKRIQEEIAEFNAKSATNKRIADERYAKRNEKSTKRTRDGNGWLPNQEPRTKNQEPIVDASSAPMPAPKPVKPDRGKRLSENWVLPKNLGEWALQNQPSWTAAHVREIADKFRDFWIAQPGAKGCKLDWAATWRNWVRNEKPLLNGSGRPGLAANHHGVEI